MKKNRSIIVNRETGLTFTSLRDACAALGGITPRGLARHLNGRSKRYSGWSFYRLGKPSV